MGALDDKAEASVRPVKSDLSVPATSPDEIVVINDGHGERIEVLEEITWWDKRDERKIVRRAASLSLIPEYEPIPISVRVMLMRPDKVPAQLTEQMLIDRRGAKLTVEPVFIRTWEIPPEECFYIGRDTAMAWVPLTKSPTEQQLLAAADMVKHDDELRWMFLFWARLRYAEEELAKLLGRFGRMFNLQYWAETPAGQDLIEIGVERGRLASAQHAIRLFLNSRHPEAAGALSADRMATPEQAENLLARLYEAQTSDEVLDLISARQ